MNPTKTLEAREAYLRHHGQVNNGLGWWLLLTSMALFVAVCDLGMRGHWIAAFCTLFLWAVVHVLGAWLKTAGKSDLQCADRVKSYLERQRGVVASPGMWRRLSQLLLKLFR